MWKNLSDFPPEWAFKCDSLAREETKRFLMRYPGNGERVCIARLYRYIGDDEIFCQTDSGMMRDNWEMFEWCAIPE